jgi:nicotinate dehydrogenase subunit B
LSQRPWSTTWSSTTTPSRPTFPECRPSNGAYSRRCRTSDPLVINAGAAALGPPYVTRTRRLRSQPAGSPVRQGSYRALGATANNFARESAIDELAYLAGADPLEFRLRHLDDERLVEVLRLAAGRFGWAHIHRGSGPSRAGRGLAVGLEKGGRVATCAEIFVDQSGRLRPRRLVTAYECGTIVDPDAVKSQIEGATVMALGGALHEAVPAIGGRPSVTRLATYPVPRVADMPHIEVVLVDRPDLPSAGAGETPMITVAAALANALFAATGDRRRRLPLDPARAPVEDASPDLVPHDSAQRSSMAAR